MSADDITLRAWAYLSRVADAALDPPRWSCRVGPMAAAQASGAVRST